MVLMYCISYSQYSSKPNSLFELIPSTVAIYRVLTSSLATLQVKHFTMKSHIWIDSPCQMHPLNHFPPHFCKWVKRYWISCDLLPEFKPRSRYLLFSTTADLCNYFIIIFSSLQWLLMYWLKRVILLGLMIVWSKMTMSRRLSRTAGSMFIDLQWEMLVPWLEEEVVVTLEKKEEVKPLDASLPSIKKGSDS